MSSMKDAVNIRNLLKQCAALESEVHELKRVKELVRELAKDRKTPAVMDLYNEIYGAPDAERKAS